MNEVDWWSQPLIVFLLLFFILQNLQTDLAEYCILRMEPYRDAKGREVPHALDYGKFTNNMFQN